MGRRASSRTGISIDAPMTDEIADVVWSSRLQDVDISDSCERSSLVFGGRSDAEKFVELLRKHARHLSSKGNHEGAQSCDELADVIEDKLK